MKLLFLLLAGSGLMFAQTPLCPAISGSGSQIPLDSAPCMGGGGIVFTYFVSKAGSDSNPCSQALPCLTIVHTESIATAGKNVEILAGTYTEDWTSAKALHWYGQGTVTVKRSTQTNDVNISANGAAYDNLIFDATGATFDTIFIGTGAANLIFTGCQFLAGPGATIEIQSTIAGLTVKSSTFVSPSAVAAIYGNMTGALFSGNSFTLTTTARALFRTKAGTNSYIFTGNTVTGVAETTSIYYNVAGADTATITNNSFTLTSAPSYFLLTASNAGTLNFTGNTVTLVSTSTGPVISVPTGGTWGVNLQNNTIAVSSTAQAFQGVLVVDQVAPVVSGNSIDMAGPADLIDVHSTGAVTCGATVVNSNTLYVRNVLVGHGMVIGEDNSSAGDHFCNGASVQSNTIYGPRFFSSSADGFILHAILIGYQINANVLGNTLIGTGYGIVLKDAGTSWTAGGVFYNVIANQQTSQPFPAVYMKGTSAVPVYNNTVYNTYTTTPVTLNNATAFKTDTNSGAANNNILRNNLTAVVDEGSVFVLNQGGTGNTFDYDGYYFSGCIGCSSFGGGFAYDGGFRATLAAWQTANSQELHGIQAAPMFTNPAAYDFTLQAGSPYINTGVCIAGVTPCPTNIGAK